MELESDSAAGFGQHWLQSSYHLLNTFTEDSLFFGKNSFCFGFDVLLFGDLAVKLLYHRTFLLVFGINFVDYRLSFALQDTMLWRQWGVHFISTQQRIPVFLTQCSGTISFKVKKCKTLQKEFFSVIYKIFSTLNILQENCEHLIRTYRAFLEGYVLLVNNKAFGHPLSIEDSFEISLQVLIAGTKTFERKETDN